MPMTLPVEIKASEVFERYKVVTPCEDSEDSEGSDESGVIGTEIIKEDYLIIYVDQPSDLVYMINLDTTARFPRDFSYKELVIAIRSERVEVTDIKYDDRVTMAEELLKKGYRKKMHRRWADIEPLTLDLESVLRNGHGDKIFSDVVEKRNATRKTSPQYIYDTFYSWLRHGCEKQGLGMPQGKDANRIPKEREIRRKQGAHNTDIARGKILDDFDLKKFKAGKRWYGKKNGPSIRKIIRKLWSKYYYKTKIKNTALEESISGKKHDIKLVDPDLRPSYNQFHYWLTKQYGGILPNRERSRKNATEYAANQRGRTGNAFNHILAPGEMFQLDETPFDEECVSVFDVSRSTLIGKVTLYFLRDTFSRIIVGVYITTENPSYATVKEALFNAGREKAPFLLEWSAPIEPDRWNVKGIPQSILVDRAEFHNKLSEGSIEDLNIIIKYTRGGRGDDKPLAETIFRVFSIWFEGVSKAHQTKSHRDIALQLARKNACLTIPELYQIAFVFIEHFNNHHVIENYPLTKSMVQDGVQPIPASLWEWGLRNRPGYLSAMSESNLYLKLLEKGEVSVHRDHIHMLNKGLRYNCEWLLESGYQDRMPSGNRAVRMPCRYHRGLVDIIFICTPDGLKGATLDAIDRRFAGLSFSEVVAQKKIERKEKANLLEDGLNSLVSGEDYLEGILRAARQQKVSISIPKLSKINENRVLESTFDRIKQSHQFLKSVQDIYAYGVGKSMLDQGDLVDDSRTIEVQAEADRPKNNDEDSFYDED